MTKNEALKLALEALELEDMACRYEKDPTPEHITKAITAIREALAQPEQEPVAWLITDENINSIQIASIQRLIDRARHAHMADLKLRINGEDEWYELDWLKHLTRATPPQRTWVGLDWNEMPEIYMNDKAFEHGAQWAEAKLKEKNT